MKSPKNRDPKAYWVGLSVKILAFDEKNAGVLANELAEYVEHSGNVLECRWDSNLPEEDIEAKDR